MELNFIRQVVQLSLISSASLAVLVGLYLGFFDGLAIFLGALWGCANLLLIKKIVENYFLHKTSNHFLNGLMLLVKFPLLYGCGYLLFTSESLPPWFLLLGFSCIVLMMVFNSIRGALLSKTSLVVIGLLSSAKLQALIESDVPEVPNFLTFYTKFYHTPFTHFLHYWETMVFSLIVAVFVSVLFYLGSRPQKLIPEGLQNFIELIVETLRKFILEILGPDGEKYVPFLGTIFVYILTMNWMVLIPFMKAPSSNFNITIALAICVFVLVQYLNFRNYGFLGFMYHLAGSPKDVMGWIMVPLMFPIELLTQLTRPLTLGLRLFGNVVGEDILIGAFALFGVMIFINYAPIVLPLQVPFMFFAMLTGLMQALVFTLLSTIYILLSIPSEHGHE